MTTRIRLGEGGRIVIPAAHRKALGVEPGDSDDHLASWTAVYASPLGSKPWRGMQEEFRRVGRPGVSLLGRAYRRPAAGGGTMRRHVTNAVFDASAVLTLLKDEAGSRPRSRVSPGAGDKRGQSV